MWMRIKRFIHRSYRGVLIYYTRGLLLPWKFVKLYLKCHWNLGVLLLIMRPGDAIWWHKTVSTLDRAITCCLMTPSPSPGPILTDHQWGLVAFMWGQFHRKYSRFLFLIWVLKLLIYDYNMANKFTSVVEEHWGQDEHPNWMRSFCPSSWWHHQMETFSALLALCAGNSLVTGEFPSQRPVMGILGDFFDLHLNKPE